jgi:hypothetical protein
VTGGTTRRTTGQVTELGAARSADDGSFTITLSTAVDAQEAACALGWRQGMRSFLVVGDGSGDGGAGSADPVEVGVRAEELVLRVAETQEPEADGWRAIAGFLAANRLVRADDLVRQLAAPFADAPSAAWPLAVRAAALAGVQRRLDADLPDPTPLLDRDHPIDLVALQGGEVAKAVNGFRNAELFQRYGGLIDEWNAGHFFHFPKSDLELYRDYLRGAWVIAARRMHGPGPSDAALEQQLDMRFHQDFHTGNVAPQPAAPLLASILRDVLLAPADRDGFGLSAADIPPQGALGDADYVAALVARTGETAAELRNRYRVRFDRSAGDETSPVQLNVEALLGLLADTYQSPEEPFATPLRAEGEQRPLIFAPYVGRAPFFLEYEEWLERQRRFFPENVYDIRRTIPSFDKQYRDAIAAQKGAPHKLIGAYNDYFVSEADWQASAAWVERMVRRADTLRAALAQAEKQSYGEAAATLTDVLVQVEDARRARNAAWARDSFPWYIDGTHWNDAADRRVSLASRAKRPVTTRAELEAFEAFFDPQTAPYVAAYENGPGPGFWDWQERWLARARTLYLGELPYLSRVLVPYLLAGIRATQGDHAGALRLLGPITGYDVGIARSTDEPGYGPDPDDPSGYYRNPTFYREESLPYTTGVAFDADTHWYADQEPFHSYTVPDAWPANRWERPALGTMELRFFKLAQADEMLAWADELYRTDEPSAIRRARELYKGVLFLHGEDPYIAPHFPRHGAPGEWLPLPGLQLPQPIIGGVPAGNPAREAQLARARAGLWQIEQGLNAYGYHPDMVPALRYRPLKQAADLFGASAKSTQSDFLQYQTRFEQAVIEGWQAAAMVQKAQAAAGIAGEQIEIAKAGVAKAQEQVAAVNAQIAAKQAEIADADSFFGQAKAFFGGIKDTLTGMVPLAEKAGNDQSPAGGSVSSGQLLALIGKSTGGASASEGAAAAALGSGAALTIGFGAFAYYGYTTMEGMADAAARRDADLKSLREVALPAAQAQVRLKERDVQIAQYGAQIAQAELQLARAIDRYQRDRFLNVDLWNNLARFAQRTMRRYIELGARMGWMAERALAFEQNRQIHIIRLDYVSSALRGLTGADRLILDLAELEATRLQGVRLTAPVKQTLSLARDFPIAYGALKRAGRCTFHTSEAALRRAFPGTYGYRIRAVTVAARDADGPAPRGILRNLGASLVSDESGAAPNRLVRFPDALPISEFRLQGDMWVYGLPGETLLQFEGSGYETDWELELPAEANPKGLRSLADVMITCDMNAMYSQALATKQAAAPAGPVSRSIALAASVWDPKGLASLADEDVPARVRFDLARLTLPAQEQNREIANLALLLVGKTEQAHAATAHAETSAVDVPFDLTDGVALSNAGALLGAQPALPLNALEGLPLVQPLAIDFDRAVGAEELAALHDVVLWVEYRADL